MDHLIESLCACPLLHDLPEERIRQVLLPHAVPRRFSPGETLIAPQEQVDWFGILLEGRVQILQPLSSGASSLMETLFPSFVVGADLIFTKSRKSPYRALAGEPTQVMVFPKDLLASPDFLSLEERLLVGQRLLTMLSQANMRKHNRLAILSQRGLRDRIVTYLTLQATRREEDSFQISFSREELADFLCVNRSALSHELSLMEQEGLIRFWKNRFVLLAGKETEEKREN